MESYFPAEANQYRYDSMMTVDTGASAEGFAPDMGVDPFDDMLPDSSFSSLFPATEPDVAMAQNPLGHHYYSMSSSVQDWQPQWELQQHSRTQSDPGSYISRLNNGQAAFAGGLSAGVSLQDDHRQTIRSASDGQIQGKHFFSWEASSVQALLPTYHFQPSRSLPRVEASKHIKGAGGRSTHSLTHSLPRPYYPPPASAAHRRRPARSAPARCSS